MLSLPPGLEERVPCGQHAPKGARGGQAGSGEASEVLSSEGGRCRGIGVRGHCVRCQDAGRSVGPEACIVGN